MQASSAVPAFPERWTVDGYFELVARGLIGPDDHVELLEGVIVAMSPQIPRHAAGCDRAYQAVLRAVGGRAAVRGQNSLVVGTRSVPEPDVAVVPGRLSDYESAHPTIALLVIEIADSSLLQDRLTKSAIYAAAGIPEYWILNLVENRVEAQRSPDPAARRYTESRIASPDEVLEIVALPDARVAVADLLPSRRSA